MKYTVINKSLTLALIGMGFSAHAAKYNVTEVPTLDGFRQHFAMSINDNGDMLGIARDSFMFPIYNEDYLLTDTQIVGSCSLSEAEVESGDYDVFTRYCMKVVLGNKTSPYYQQIGDIKSFLFDANTQQTELLNLVDVIDAQLGDYTRSNIEQLTSINNVGQAVGTVTAPYLPVDFQQTGDNAAEEPVRLWQRDYKNRAVALVNGETVLIAPEFDLYGGNSSAYSISDAGFVAGYTSIGMPESAVNLVNSRCIENDNAGLAPLQVCVNELQRSSSLFTLRPAIWQVNGNGEIVDTQVFDLAFEPTETQIDNYDARATAVNSLGQAVGISHYPQSAESRIVTRMPVVFTATGTELIFEYGDYKQGYAFDINDDGFVIGQALTGAPKNLEQFFVYNVNSKEFKTPKTFYETADSIANAINENGYVVGQAEYEVTNESTRRRHGFIYNVNTEEFFDINDLIACDLPYEIVEIRDINNNNQIMATALKIVPQRDGDGNVVNDSNGDPQEEQVAITVRLDPIDGGEIETCIDEENTPYERKGLAAHFGLAGILVLLGLIRRRFFIAH